MIYKNAFNNKKKWNLVTQKKAKLPIIQSFDNKDKAWATKLYPCALVSVFLFFSLPAYALDLSQLLLSARARDPACAIARAQLIASNERRIQARAGLLPTVNFTLANNKSQYDAELPEERQFWTTQWAVQLTQPLFRPANFYELSQAQKFEAQAKAALASAESDLAERVATAWFDVLTAQEILRALHSQKDATQQQFTAAKRSFDVGVVSIADVREVEAKHAVVLAQESLAENDLLLKREVLEQITAVPIDELDSSAWMKPELANRLNTLQNWMNATQESNPTMVQAKYQLQASRLEISKARAGRLPTIDFVANKNDNSATGATYTDSHLKNNTVQTGVQVAMPLFSGLAASAKVKEAIALQDKALGERDLAADQVAINVKQAYFGLRGALAQLPSLELALKANEVAVQANKRGYQVGMRTNVDLLNAMAQLYQTEKDLAKARTDAWLFYIRLRILTGQWTEADLHAF